MTVIIIVMCFASFSICGISSNFKIKQYSIQFSPLLQLSALLILCRIDGHCWTLIQMLSNLQFIFSGVTKTAGIMLQMHDSLGFEEFSLVFCLF